jgi:hypothetical protein
MLHRTYLDVGPGVIRLRTLLQAHTLQQRLFTNIHNK